MKVLDPAKMLLLSIALVGGFSLAIAGGLTHEAAMLTSGVGIIGSVVGYLTGNGRLAAKEQEPVPVIAHRDAGPGGRINRTAADDAARLHDYDEAEAGS